jgi:hypothetical protein
MAYKELAVGGFFGGEKFFLVEPLHGKGVSPGDVAQLLAPVNRRLSARCEF